MSVLVSDVSTLVRYLVLDLEKIQNPGDLYTYTGTSNVFAPSQTNFAAYTNVYWNGNPTTNYTVDSANRLQSLDNLQPGDTLELQYTYYPNWSDTELEAFVRAAAIHLSVNNYYTWDIDPTSDEFWPEPTDREKNLVAFIASILVKPDNMTIRLPDMTINVPTTSLPTRDIISKAVRIFKHSTTGVFDVVGFGSAFPTTYYYYFR